MKKKLTADFFERNPVDVAADLIGKVLVKKTSEGIIEAVVTETEAYGGQDDPASHAFRKQTPRNWPMYAEAGLTYVYFVYGMHYCFNVSVGKPGQVGAVLIRAVQVLPDYVPVIGPGRVGKLFHFTSSDSGVQTLKPSSSIFFEDQGFAVQNVQSSARIGIQKALDKQWRFTGTILR